MKRARFDITQNAQESKEDISYCAFCIAKYDEYHELLKILLDAGADPNYKREEYPGGEIFTEACMASINGEVSKNARLLVGRGANPKIRGRILAPTKTPLVNWLIELGNKEEEVYKYDPCLGLP